MAASSYSFRPGRASSMQRADAGIGDRRGAPHALQLERPFAARHVLDDVLGVDRRLPERLDDLVMQFDMHRLTADEPDLAGDIRASAPELFEWPHVRHQGLFLRARDIPNRRKIKHRRIVQRHDQHRLRTDADEVGEIGDVVHAQKIMPPGIVHEQSLQSLARASPGALVSSGFGILAVRPYIPPQPVRKISPSRSFSKRGTQNPEDKFPPLKKGD